MNLLPRFLLGGLLLALGSQMCQDWIIAARSRMDAYGHLVLYAMLAVSLVLGMTQAVFIGLLAAVVTSHLRFSQLNALKYHLTACTYHPQLSRPLHVQARAPRSPCRPG